MDPFKYNRLNKNLVDKDALSKNNPTFIAEEDKDISDNSSTQPIINSDIDGDKTLLYSYASEQDEIFKQNKEFFDKCNKRWEKLKKEEVGINSYNAVKDYDEFGLF